MGQFCLEVYAHFIFLQKEENLQNSGYNCAELIEKSYNFYSSHYESLSEIYSNFISRFHLTGLSNISISCMIR